jgi:hypothetical protein
METRMWRLMIETRQEWCDGEVEHRLEMKVGWREWQLQDRDDTATNLNRLSTGEMADKLVFPQEEDEKVDSRSISEEEVLFEEEMMLIWGG